LEVFSLNRQAAAFLAVIAVMVVAMVFISPFLLVVLGGIGVVLVAIVWLKAGVRGRAVLAPFGPAEGALALSALLFVMGSAVVTALMFAQIGYGESFALFRAMLPVISQVKDAAPRRGGAVSYGDPEDNQRAKEELGRAGIPFTVENREGKEWISWPPEHEAAAQAVQERMRNAVPNGRNVSFPDAPDRQKAFTDWLTRNGIKYEVVRRRGREIIVWDEAAPDALDRFNAQSGGNCPKRKAC